MGRDEPVAVMMPNRSRLAFALSLLLAPAAAAAQTPPGGGMPAPPPEEDLPPEAMDPVDTTPVDATPVETPEAVMAEVPVEPPPPPPNPDKLKVSKEGFFTPAILLQGWFVADRGPSGGDATTAANTDTFRIRRAEFHAKGQLIPDKVQYEVHADFAKVLEPKSTTIPTTPPVTIKEPNSRLGVLQDVYLTYLTKHVDVSLGQFKIPVSWEGYNSSGKLLFPERAITSRTFGDIRDIGLRLTKTYKKWMYSAGVFNGTGANALDNNNGKDVALRLECYPIKGLTLAGVTYDSVFNRKEPGAKDRWELDVRYEKDAILVQAEALMAVDYDASSTKLPGRGFYTSFAYRLANNVQPALRVGAFDPNTDNDDDGSFNVDVGVNYYLQDHNAKLQGMFSRTQFTLADKVADNLLVLAAQIQY